MPTKPQDVFDAMPGMFEPQKAGNANLTIQFKLSGEHGGEWAVEIANGQCSTHSGIAEKPTATIHASDKDLLAVLGGQLNAVAAYMSGKIRVDGNVIAIMNLLSYFQIPNA